jgi:hypothetical protein
MSLASFSAGLYRPYLQATSGLGQGRTLLSIIYGGPRAGAGSAVRIYNFYKQLPDPIKSNFLLNLKKNAVFLRKDSVGTYNLHAFN